MTIQVLLEGLVDYQGHSSSGACVVLNNILKSRGSSLKNEVRILLSNIYSGTSLLGTPLGHPDYRSIPISECPD